MSERIYKCAVCGREDETVHLLPFGPGDMICACPSDAHKLGITEAPADLPSVTVISRGDALRAWQIEREQGQDRIQLPQGPRTGVAVTAHFALDDGWVELDERHEGNIVLNLEEMLGLLEALQRREPAIRAAQMKQRKQGSDG